MPQPRRTKIVATVGPASDSPEVLTAMAAAGMDVVRVPLAHGTLDDALARVRLIRRLIPKIAIMPDLPGPKIRAAAFPPNGVELVSGSTVRLQTASDGEASSADRIGVCHP
ncbi:MAG TPA: pyruvate kinase, partial [Acidimicrobiales bacterium]|nr:pyruvate kinase [Acidimicrobiales bacterium]